MPETFPQPPAKSPTGHSGQSAASDRPQTLGEEIANSVSHGAGLVAAIVGTVFLLLAAARHGSALGIVAASVFAATMLLMYLASTLYHALPRGRAKRWLMLLDHSAIFLFIAGTYTPLALMVLRGAWGWTIFGVVWGLAVGGVLLKILAGLRFPRLSLGLYLGMGWLIVVAAWPLWRHLPTMGLVWLLAGGVAYTAGVRFYRRDHIRYNHTVWHFFVIAGTAFQYFAILRYAA